MNIPGMPRQVGAEVTPSVVQPAVVDSNGYKPPVFEPAVLEDLSIERVQKTETTDENGKEINTDMRFNRDMDGNLVEAKTFQEDVSPIQRLIQWMRRTKEVVNNPESASAVRSDIEGRKLFLESERGKAQLLKDKLIEKANNLKKVVAGGSNPPVPTPA